MESLVNLECFARSAEERSFSRAARRLSLTPAAVSRNVAVLEKNLGVRLFQRSTRRLTITEAGERLLEGIGDKLDGIQQALAGITDSPDEAVGTLRVSMPVTFGLHYVLPLLPDFLARYPGVRIDWQFDNRPVDLITERFDAAIGAGFDLADGIIARRLAPFHLVAVAAPVYMENHPSPERPRDLAQHEGIGLRLDTTGRMSEWTMRDAAGHLEAAALAPRHVFNDPLPVAHAALAGLGVAVLAVPDALPYLENGSLIRLLPNWFTDRGNISLYHATPKLLPHKTRAFIDYVVEHCRSEKWADGLRAS